MLLCVFMNQPYMNYYFTALVSFWYTVVYVVMALPPRIDVTSPDRTFRDFGCGAFKIVVLAVMIALLSYSEVRISCTTYLSSSANVCIGSTSGHANRNFVSLGRNARNREAIR